MERAVLNDPVTPETAGHDAAVDPDAEVAEATEPTPVESAPVEPAPPEPEPAGQRQLVLTADPNPEPEPITEPEAELEAVVEPEPEVAAEPEAVVEPEPEPEVAAEPEAVVQPEPEAEPELEAAPEPEPEVAAEPEPEPEPELTGFEALDLPRELLKSLSELGYEEPTPIQAEAIPPIMAGNDLIGQAATGTGKTAAFALPILSRIDLSDGARKTPQALVLCPTRELAVQVSEAIYKYGRGLGVRVLPVYGGQPIGRQLSRLNRGIDVVVATPGRAVDHLHRGSLALDDLKMVVLDEADEMLDMGFADDLDELLGGSAGNRQTVLFSATVPARIKGLAGRHLSNPVRISIGDAAPSESGAPLVSQRVYVVHRAHKAAALGRILDVESPEAALVFCRTRVEVDQLTETMNGRGYRAEALHGGLNQQERDKVMGRLRGGIADLLVATDVAARGLDVDHLTHVVNYDVPSAPETYVHRIGRVGRAGREGVAITLSEPRERRQLDNIERLTGRRMEMAKVPSAAQRRSRQLEQLAQTLRSTLENAGVETGLEGSELDTPELEAFAPVVEALEADYSERLVLLAALKLVQEVSGVVADDQEIPDVAARGTKVKRDQGGRNQRGDGPRGRDRDSRGSGERGSGERSYRGSRADERGERGGPRGRDDRGRDDRGASRGKPDGDMARIFVGVGKNQGVRPGDLVGAIANETRVDGPDIGKINVAPNFTIVEVPDRNAREVITALRATTIRGETPTVRFDKAGSDEWEDRRGDDSGGRSGGGGYQGRGGGRDDRGGDRPDRGGYQGRSDRGGGDSRGGYQGRGGGGDSRGGYQGRGGGGDRPDRGGYKGRDDRGGGRRDS
jgi:ATP-dependent RNA helicase DeaD